MLYKFYFRITLGRRRIYHFSQYFANNFTKQIAKSEKITIGTVNEKVARYL